MKEAFSFVEEAEKIAEKNETRYIHDLSKWVDGAEKSSCRCPHCVAEADRSRKALDDELIRVFYDDVGPIEDDKPNLPDFKAYGIDDPADPMNPFGNMPQKT